MLLLGELARHPSTRLESGLGARNCAGNVADGAAASGGAPSAARARHCVGAGCKYRRCVEVPRGGTILPTDWAPDTPAAALGHRSTAAAAAAAAVRPPSPPPAVTTTTTTTTTTKLPSSNPLPSRCNGHGASGCVNLPNTAAELLWAYLGSRARTPSSRGAGGRAGCRPSAGGLDEDGGGWCAARKQGASKCRRRQTLGTGWPRRSGGGQDGTAA